MNKSISFCLILLLLLTSSCSPPQRPLASNLSFEQSETLFDKEFPRSWPPWQIKGAFTDEQSKAIIQMTNSLSELLRKRKIEHEKTDSAVLIISPTDGSKINKTSKTLSKNNITIRYDAKYFAKNPFFGRNI